MKPERDDEQVYEEKDHREYNEGRIEKKRKKEREEATFELLTRVIFFFSKGKKREVRVEDTDDDEGRKRMIWVKKTMR